MNTPGRPFPNTFEHIESIASREPNRLALVQDTRSWSYQALYSDLVRAIRVLHAMGIKRGDRVAVGTSGFQSGLLLLLASEALGATTLSFLHANDADAQDAFTHADWVFSNLPQQVPASARFVLVDEAFIAKVVNVDLGDPSPLPLAPLGFDEPQRISRTSGSTGRAKFMVLRRAAQEWWIHRAMTTGTLRRDSRVLLLGPLVLNANLVAASAVLRFGAAVFSLPPAAVASHPLTNIVGLPSMLEQVLDALPPGYAPPAPVELMTMGGFVSPQVAERASRIFGRPVRSRYGTNEAGGVCEELDANGVGKLSAGVDLRIVDESGRDLPQGQLGIICVRTPAMADGYIGDPEATKAAFRDGWFHSGDWGMLVAPRTLRLAGRWDDLVNIGGIKVAATVVETKVRELVKVADCAAIAVNLPGGTTMGIVLVSDVADREAARRTIAQGLGLGTTTRARVLFVDKLPRTQNGKVDRVALHALLSSPPPGTL
jgi:acyl-coenzyme A synthetase/AMP-(fatty) acid ligase